MRLARPSSVRQDPQAGGGGGIEVGATGATQPPRQRFQPRQRPEQHGVALARRQRSHAQQRPFPAARPLGQRRGIGSRHHHRALFRRDAVIGQRPRGAGTGDDHAPDLTQRLALARVQALARWPRPVRFPAPADDGPAPPVAVDPDAARRLRASRPAPARRSPPAPVPAARPTPRPPAAAPPGWASENGRQGDGVRPASRAPPVQP